MPRRFLVVCEAEADFQIASLLATRMIHEKVPWLDEEQVSYLIQWAGKGTDRLFWLWREIDDVARAAGIKVKGHFDGKPGLEDAQTARRALIYLGLRADDGQPIDGVILIRDSDNKPDERRIGLEQGRDAVPNLQRRTAIGVAHVMRECWVLVGFEPKDAKETARHGDLVSTLSFDPCREPHRLRDKGDGETRSAKRVLEELTQGDPEREAACWSETPLTTLRERGGPTGLTAYLAEVEARLVPLFVGPSHGRAAS